ncbi:MAG: hypothetical protein WCW33_04100 [Candidatus Babeliales bacterium]|jgi:hypothetical protein
MRFPLILLVIVILTFFAHDITHMTLFAQSTWTMGLINELERNSKSAPTPSQRLIDLKAWLNFLENKTVTLYPTIFNPTDQTEIAQLKSAAIADISLLTDQIAKAQEFKTAAENALAQGVLELAALFQNATYNDPALAPIITAQVQQITNQLTAKIETLISRQKENSIAARADLIALLNSADDAPYFDNKLRQRIIDAQQAIAAYQESCLDGKKFVDDLKDAQKNQITWGNQIDAIIAMLQDPANGELERDFIIVY